MTYSHSIRKTFNIKDQNIIFSEDHTKLSDKKINGVTYQVFEARLTYIPKACEKCGIKNHDYSVIKHGTKTSTIKLGNIMFQPALLHLKKQRFLCKACDQTFTASTSLVEKHCYISNIIKSHIALELQEIQSMKAIANRVVVSSHTVIRVLNNLIENLNPNPNALPEHLSFDEFKSVKEAEGAMSFIYTDSRSHDLIDIIENRQQSQLISYFQKYPYSVRKRVKTVTIDMYSPYIGVVKDCFPNAKLIIDRFHIVQHLNRALNKYRIEVMNKIRYTRQKDYRKLKKQWKLLLQNSWTLDYERYTTHRLYEGMMTQKMMVDYLLSIDPQFRWIHELINDLKYSLSIGDFEQFKYHLNRSKKRPLRRYIRTTIQTLEKYSGAIKNSCHYTLSNGHLEGINNKIKTMKRTGFGYRNFQHLRARTMISFKLTENRNRKVRPLIFKEEQDQSKLA